jgi:hypothetical protein
MLEGLFQPAHLLVMLFASLMTFGPPFLAGFYLGRYLELKKSKNS